MSNCSGSRQGSEIDSLYTSRLFRFINSLSCARRSEVSTVSISIEKRTAVLAKVLWKEDLEGAKNRRGEDNAVRCRRGEARHKKSMGVTCKSNLEDKRAGEQQKGDKLVGLCSWSRAGRAAGGKWQRRILPLCLGLGLEIILTTLPIITAPSTRLHLLENLCYGDWYIVNSEAW